MATTYPFDDSMMKYDYDNHRYILTLDAVKLKLGIDLTLKMNSPYITDKNLAAQHILDDISAKIYHYVYTYNEDNAYQCYLMAKNPNARAMIQSAMLFELDYIMRNGAIDEFTWVGMSNQVKLEDIRGDRAIHPEAIQALRTPLDQYGLKLLFSGKYWYNKGVLDSAEGSY